MRSGKKRTKSVEVECPACDIVRHRMRRETGDQIKIANKWHVKGATAGAKSKWAVVDGVRWRRR